MPTLNTELTKLKLRNDSSTPEGSFRPNARRRATREPESRLSAPGLIEFSAQSIVYVRRIIQHMHTAAKHQYDMGHSPAGCVHGPHPRPDVVLGAQMGDATTGMPPRSSCSCSAFSTYLRAVGPEETRASMRSPTTGVARGATGNIRAGARTL